VLTELSPDQLVPAGAWPKPPTIDIDEIWPTHADRDLGDDWAEYDGQVS
jgi:hypothetical protein